MTGTGTTGTGPSVTSPGAGGDVGAGGDATAQSGDADAGLTATSTALPPKWQGTGVLAARSERLPKQAPPWAHIAAEVVEHDGKRYLVTTGRATKIRDPSLSRSTAEARARALIAQWTKSPRGSGGMVSDVWRDPKTGDTLVRVEVEVPAGWAPGTPL